MTRKERYHADPEFRARVIANNAAYRKRHLTRVRAAEAKRRRERYHSDPDFRARVSAAITRYRATEAGQEVERKRMAARCEAKRKSNRPGHRKGGPRPAPENTLGATL